MNLFPHIEQIAMYLSVSQGNDVTEEDCPSPPHEHGNYAQKYHWITSLLLTQPVSDHPNKPVLWY